MAFTEDDLNKVVRASLDRRALRRQVVATPEEELSPLAARLTAVAAQRFGRRLPSANGNGRIPTI